MKAPRCKICGKEHYGLCKEAAKSVGPKVNLRKLSAARAAMSSVVNPVPSSAPSVGSLGSVKSRTAADSPAVPPADISTSDGQTTPLAVGEPVTSVKPDVRLWEQSLSEMAVDVLRDIGEGKPPLVVPGPPIEDVERALSQPDSPEPEITELMRGTPLTPAQKQKTYRERGGDELRERERLRKVAKRKSDDTSH